MLWFLIGAVALAGWIVLIYNGLVRLRVQTNSAWSDIDVQLKRRYDLVPNLVETVKGYAAHEKETLEAVIEARNRAMAARTLLGARRLERVLGFEEFLRRVEMFEKYLPFAMALSVEQKWAEAFAEMYREPPDWYRGSNLRGFNTRSFVSDLNRMSTQAAGIMASSPRSSGGSGFGGGGGFSGGGFGGGGTGGF